MKKGYNEPFKDQPTSRASSGIGSEQPYKGERRDSMRAHMILPEEDEETIMEEKIKKMASNV